MKQTGFLAVRLQRSSAEDHHIQHYSLTLPCSPKTINQSNIHPPTPPQKNKNPTPPYQKNTSLRLQSLFSFSVCSLSIFYISASQLSPEFAVRKAFQNAFGICQGNVFVVYIVWHALWISKLFKLVYHLDS